MAFKQTITRLITRLMDKLRRHKMVLRVPVLYLVFAALWIILSDSLVEAVFPDREAAAMAQTYKGWLFVVVTAILLGFTLRRELILHDRDQQRIGVIQSALDETSIRFRALFESSPVGIAVTNGSSIIYCNPEFAIMFGFTSAADLEGRPLIDRIAGPSREEFTQSFSFAIQDLLNSVQFEARGLCKDGSEISLVIQAGKVKAGMVSEVVSFFIDSTRQKTTEQALITQIDKLNALRAIDTAINYSMELKPVLNTILEQVIAQLKVDAAAIFLLRKNAETLELGASRGFNATSFHRTQIPLGEDPAGQAALSREMIALQDLRASQPFANKEGILEEGFQSAFVVPLVAKGVVKGVLEVFHRSLIEPDTVWLDFLDTLAGQTAIAIDSAFTYDDLHRSNIELIRAYEETIEGWSNALDLRDHETEGHTRRVTNLTLKLARAVGLQSDGMIHIQRGANLHDIGKMGIPDSILLKPGPLTEEEREIMKRHPVYAFEMISPISYLRPALEIPYCHHEKWDGSGYPRGLSGEAIPLEARVFSVVDVFDALRSDRPYRKGWPEKETLEYISGRAGVDFDPAVVRVFLELMKNQRESFLDGDIPNSYH